MRITREIENGSRYFEGNPQKGWKLAGVQEEEKNFVYYYLDKQGNFHHTKASRGRTYEPYKVEVNWGNDGVGTARVIHKRTGKPHPAMLR